MGDRQTEVLASAVHTVLGDVELSGPDLTWRTNGIVHSLVLADRLVVSSSASVEISDAGEMVHIMSTVMSLTGVADVVWEGRQARGGSRRVQMTPVALRLAGSRVALPATGGEQVRNFIRQLFSRL